MVECYKSIKIALFIYVWHICLVWFIVQFWLPKKSSTRVSTYLEMLVACYGCTTNSYAKRITMIFFCAISKCCEYSGCASWWISRLGVLLPWANLEVYWFTSMLAYPILSYKISLIWTFEGHAKLQFEVTSVSQIQFESLPELWSSPVVLDVLFC